MRLVKVAALALIVGMGLGIGLSSWWGNREPRTVTVWKDNIKEVLIDRPVLRTRDVVKVVEDKTNIRRLMDEAKARDEQITALTETITELRATGQGAVIIRDNEVHFKDWRLTFDAKDYQATYSLTQKFEAVTAVGKDRTGRPTATTAMFEIGPEGQRMPLPATKTTLVAALPDSDRWRAHFAIQLGGGVTALAVGDNPPVAVVAGQWLTRGTGPEAENSLWAALTPALVLGTGVHEVGLLPFSLNVGKLPKQPFRDLWVSPLVTRNRMGVVVTATF